MNLTNKPSLAIAPLLVLALAACGTNPPPVAPGPSAASAPADTTPLAPAPSGSAAPAANDEFAKVEIKAQKVAGNVYMLQGSGGNIGVLVGDDGIVIVDDEFAPLAAKIRAALKDISDKPIKFVINTHWHGDHTGGNAAFGADGPIVAQENVRKRLMEGRPKRTFGGEEMPETPPAPKAALPVVTFEDNVAIHVDGEDVRAVHYPAGHTDGDSVIYFTKANVVHMGDDFVTYGFPFVDVGSGGSVRGMIAAVDKAIAELPADVKIIPGHGDVSTLDDVRKFSAMLKDVVHIVDAAIKKKKTLDQIKADKPLAKYDALGKGFVSTDVFIEMVYNELTEKKSDAKNAKAAPAKAAP